MSSSNRTSLRSQMRQKRSALTEQVKRERAEAFLQIVSQHPIYVSARHLGLYHALPSELATKGLVQHAWSEGKKVYLPVTCQESGVLRFALYTEGTVVEKTKLGFYQPLATQENTVVVSKLECVVVPAVAVDKDGYRLGFGQGWYDRTFNANQNKAKPYLMYVGFKENLCDNVWPQKHDVKADEVIIV